MVKVYLTLKKAKKSDGKKALKKDCYKAQKGEKKIKVSFFTKKKYK